MDHLPSKKREEYEALFRWLTLIQQGTSDPPCVIDAISDLWDGRRIHQILQLIQNYPKEAPMEAMADEDWKRVMAELKKLSKNIRTHYDKHLTSPAPEECDVREVAQNRNPVEIMKLIVWVFGACVQAPNKMLFIRPIMELKTEQQMILKRVIETKGFVPGEAPKPQRPSLRDMDKPLTELEIRQQKINQLFQKVQSQQGIIEKLEKQLFEERILRQAVEKKLHNTQIQLGRIREQMENVLATEQLQLPQKMELEKADRQELSSVLIEDLKTKMYAETEKHFKEVSELKQHIEFLEQKLQRKTAEMEQQEEFQREQAQQAQNGSPTKNIFLDHPPCISINKHYELLNAKAQKITEMQKAQWEMERQNLQLKLQNENLQRDKTKLETLASQKSELITRTDYDSLKVNVLQLLRDKFKTESERLSKAMAV